MASALLRLGVASSFLLAACEQEPAGVPATVTAALAATAQLCSDVGGQPRTEKAVQRADLNADGQDDFVLYSGWIECEGASSIYGDREKGVTVFAGRGGGDAAQVFSDAVFGAQIETASGRSTLWLTTAGQRCGSPPAPDFARETFCDRPVVWDEQTQRFDYAPLSAIRLIQ